MDRPAPLAVAGMVIAGATVVLLAHGQAAVLDTGTWDQVEAVTVTNGPEAAMNLLEDLPVQEASSTAGYDRDLFGPSWSDDVNVEGGHNGCDTRNDLLRRDLVDVTIRSGTRGCVVQSGTLHDPYTGHVMPFLRGTDEASQIHVDHVVSLANAWATGAQNLDEQTRRDLANDPLNLWVVDGAQNQAKSDADVAEWLPPHRGSWCDLVTTQLQVKAKYDLWATPAEVDTMRQILNGCTQSVTGRPVIPVHLFPPQMLRREPEQPPGARHE